MAHWAEVDDKGTVLRVIACDADDGQDGTLHPPAFCTDVLGGTWVRTYYATEGKTFAGIGYRWDPSLGDFVAPPTVVVDGDPILVNPGLDNPELSPPGG